MADDGTSWLRGEETLFGSRGRTAADVAYRKDLSFYADGYQRSAEMLFEAVQRSSSYADSQFFALAFLWRHSLELRLKNMQSELNELDRLQAYGKGEEAPNKIAPRGHSLLLLWKAIEPRLKEIFPGQPETGWIAAAIGKFHSVDPGAEDFRYPTKVRDGSETLGRLPRVVTFEELDKDMRALMSTLSGAAWEITSRRDHILEMLAHDGECQR